MAYSPTTTNATFEYDKNNQLEVAVLSITKTADGSLPIDIISIYENILIYEDMFQGAISARLIIRDQSSLISSLPIVGGEKIKIKYKTASYAQYVELDFVVYKVGQPEIANGPENITVSQLFLCSPEVFWAANNDISKGYEGSYADIITALIRESGTTKSITVGDSAANGLNTFVCPMWNIFTAIKWCASRANPASLSPMFFWETSSGYVFKSLDDIYNSTPYKKIYIQDRNQAVNMTSDQVFNTCYRYEVMESNDKLKQFSDFAFGNSTYVLDLTNKQISKVDHSYVKDVFNTQKIHLDSFPVSDDAVSFRNKSDFILMKTDHSEISDFTSKSTISLMDNTRLMVQVPGDSNMCAGDILNVDIPIKVGLSIGKNLYTSGKFLVRSIKHSLQKATYVQTLELSKDSFATALTAASTAL